MSQPMHQDITRRLAEALNAKIGAPVGMHLTPYGGTVFDSRDNQMLATVGATGTIRVHHAGYLFEPFDANDTTAAASTIARIMSGDTGPGPTRL